MFGILFASFSKRQFKVIRQCNFLEFLCDIICSDIFCKKSIQIDPNYSEAYNNLGLVFKELEEHKKAIDS